MKHISEYFPKHVWMLVFALALVAAAGLFVPPSLTESFGLSIAEHIVALGAVEFGSAVGIGALVVAYRDPVTGQDDSEWDYDP